MRRTETLEFALRRLRPLDQEILVLRHFEELSNRDVATTLELTPAATSRLYIRAMKRLTEQMSLLSHQQYQPFWNGDQFTPFSVGALPS